MQKVYAIVLAGLLSILSGSAFKRTLVDVKLRSTRVSVSTSDYEAFASSVMGNAGAIKNRISKPFLTLFTPNDAVIGRRRLYEPIQVDYITLLEIKDFFPFVVVSVIAFTLSLLSRSLIPAQVIFSAELLFLVFCATLSTFKLNSPPHHVEMENDRDWDILWGDVLRTVTSPRKFFSDWFIQCEFEDIRREDAYDFLSWAMYTTLPDNLDAKQAKSVERALLQIEHASTLTVNDNEAATQLHSQFRFPDRSSGDLPLRSMRSSIEPLRWIHKPLSLYFLLQVLLGTVNVRYSLFADGYEHKTAGKLKYWINKTSSSKTRLPILFFHGIGGVFSYLKLLSGLNIFGCPIVIVEMPYVSLHVAPHVPTIDEHVTAVEQILDENGFEGAIIVGHSFGTTVMSWLVQSMPNRIAGAVFLDPVVFMLHLRDISFNWMYGSCNNVGHEVSNLGVEDIFGIVKTELFAANAVQRHFYWARNILWAHDLQDKQVESIVLLSGSDRVVPSLEVARHIQEHNLHIERSGQQSCIDSEIFETAGHGSLVFEEEFRAKALKSIGVIIEKSHANWRGFSKGVIASPVADTLMTSADTTADHPLIAVSLASRDSIEIFSSPIDKK